MRRTDGKRPSSSLSVAHRRLIPRLAEHMVITAGRAQVFGNFLSLCLGGWVHAVHCVGPLP